MIIKYFLCNSICCLIVFSIFVLPLFMVSGQDFLSSVAVKRLRRELVQLEREKDFHISVRLQKDEAGNEDLSRWFIIFEGSEESLYEGYYLEARMNFPPKYPNMPPVFYFNTKMWHPNVYNDGKVCISILHTADDAVLDPSISDCSWTAVQSVRTVCLSILSMLNEPNVDSPANVDAAKQLRLEPEEYKKKVKEILEEEAKKIEKV